MKKFLFLAFAACGLLSAPRGGHAQAFTGLQVGGLGLSVYTAPGATPTSYGVTGLNTNDSLIGIDYFSSSTGQLFGMGASGTLYTLAQSGTSYAATVNAASGITNPTAIDFNPVANRLRFYAGTSNYRLTPGTGLLTSDGMLAFVAGDTNAGTTPSLTAAAYINNYPGFTATSLYSLDANLDALILNTGTPQFNGLTTVGTLTLNGTRLDITAGTTGFDVLTGANGNTAYLSSNNTLYTVNLANGTLTSLGTLPGAPLRDIAFAAPEPGTYAILALGGVGLAVFAYRRRRSAMA